MENRAGRIFDDPRKLTYQLVKKITNDFTHELGRGTFGRVFKGLLEDEEVAVKVLHYFTPDISDQQFQNEFENLKRLKHPNIVRLVGFCDESEDEKIEHNGEIVIGKRIHRALCLEYVPNGSLGKLLSGEYLGNNWPIRYKIIKGICNGLKYLREGLEVPIFHFDLKPDNILLDDKMVPKIADFGLSRLIGEENTIKTMSLLGTIGYLPPEFINNQVISQEYDIFSLGVIIAQIITGITGYFDIADMGAQEFIDHVHEKWKTSLQEIPNYESLEVDCKQVKRCIEIAINCMEKERRKRPTIKDIVRKLDETGTVEIDSHFQMKKTSAKLRSLLVSPEDQLPEPLTKLQKDKLELLKQDLEAINTSLVNLSWVEAPNMMVKHWMNEVRDLSYDIEDYIDKTMHPGPNSSGESRSDSEVEELSTLVKQAKDAQERHNRYNLGRWASNPRFMIDEQGRVPIPRLNGEATILVGISDSKAELIKRLNNGAKQRLVVCIQGSPGVGKTTLAKEVYCEMEGQFECGAFVRASKMPDTRRLLGGIISQIQHRHQGPPHGLPVQELIDSLRKHLQQKRYLIVIDGLWETTSWDIVSSAFPDDAHCSRILITTDIEEVALECCDYESDAIFKMEPLGGNYSTELFFNRVFGFKHECSKQLKENSEEIIRTCGGLPLAIISIASIFATQPDNLELWRHVKEALFFRLRYNLSFDVMLREIVGLSYNSLPHHLKTCLLYLSMYPEGYTFLKADLVKQWSAEGFIIAVEEKRYDEVAECYFDELICRGLIQPHHTNISDEVILYTLHSTVFEVIRTMSNEENFCTVIDYSNTISELSVKVRRLSLRFSSAKYATKPESITLSPVRSFIFYGLVECLPSIMEFEVLRVLILDVWGDHDQEELDLSGIDRLFQLRYMRITSNIIVKLPAMVIGLPFLQTMEIYARVTSIPSDIIHLPRLLHLCVRGEINLSKVIGHMGSLRTLQSFDLSSNSEDNIRQLGEMTDLRDLHVISPTEMSDPVKGKLIAFVSSLEKLGNLKSIILAPVPSCTSISLDCSWSISSLSVFLQRLELLPPICIFSRLPVWIGQLRNLLILKIVLRELTSGDVDIIAKLQELTIVSLYVRQPTTELIVFHRAAFPVLKYFKFRCGIMHIAFQPDAMPSLRRLKLEFNAHSGEQNGNMLAGIEHLLNLQEITGRIGSAPGAEETDRMAAEFLFKGAISRHSRLTNFNLRIVRPFDEEIPRFADATASCFGADKFNRHLMADGISALTDVTCVPEVSP